MITKKELVLAAMDNKPTERVPVGFWFHFLADEIGTNAFRQPVYTEQLLAGEVEYIERAKPDFVKIMTDGFFPYENETVRHLHSAADFRNIRPLADDDPWFTQQIAYARRLTDRFGADLAMFYNLFCAATTIRFMQPDWTKGEAFLAEAIREDADSVRYGFDIISDDLAKLAKRLVTEAKVTGIYFGLQNILGKGMTKETYAAVAAPGEKKILAAANSVSAYHILHICGYAGHRNDLTWYTDYYVKTVNWAAVVEGIHLEKGRKLFGDRAVLGGFGNLDTDVLYKGSKEEVEAETKRILAQAGRQGVILGADCTVPRNTDWRRFDWVRDAAK
ncbi:uroporphyrinogen decarboxylase family protein [Megasphaera vaginalis (ex Srinivasan et al. 2021)]|uniref:Uroporphyrinogen decarboxylase n=1 Tax=Megasphaera vaginalis (ex Srinivasan et al. 2021) TaxID=1111454 RepID=U7UEZ1_9FIRM|nr:uroporphyrinogen decarboxylase family protein [Megasphaera vaginalis (ex Srinivasan et al. 2021)]ERT58002.1 uroporphyrinogen decarboxylase [Megasphaera vaginalis (ex Srinivasan et al. 2021)]